MKDRCTLYGDSVLGFRKMLMCLMVVLLSVFPVFQEPNALSVAIFVQGVSNIDNFWDFLKERDICKPLRSAIKVLIWRYHKSDCPGGSRLPDSSSLGGQSYECEC